MCLLDLPLAHFLTASCAAMFPLHLSPSTHALFSPLSLVSCFFHFVSGFLSIYFPCLSPLTFLPSTLSLAPCSLKPCGPIIGAPAIAPSPSASSQTTSPGPPRCCRTHTYPPTPFRRRRHPCALVLINPLMRRYHHNRHHNHTNR